MRIPIAIIAINGISSAFIIIGALALGGVVLVFVIGRTISNLLTQIRNSLPVALVSHLKRELESGEFDQRMQEPVSLSGMDRIYGPMIQEDFPELNLEELKRRAERLAYTTMAAIDAEDLGGLSESSDLYSTQVRQYLERLQNLGHHEHFQDITIHRIVLSDYQKHEGTCRIHFQLAIGARYQKTSGDGQMIAGHDGLTQFQFEIEALYVQDRDQLVSQSIEALAFNCPNCGAPIPSLGDRKCQFCGSAIEPLNIKVWTFSSFKRSDKV